MNRELICFKAFVSKHAECSYLLIADATRRVPAVDEGKDEDQDKDEEKEEIKEATGKPANPGCV